MALCAGLRLLCVTSGAADAPTCVVQLHSRPYADVAQLVEHFTRNEGVRGSNPRVGSRLGYVAARDTYFPQSRGSRRSVRVGVARAGSLEVGVIDRRGELPALDAEEGLEQEWRQPA